MSDTDFIIRRLRSVDFTGDRILPASTVEEVVLPAADEIERLRNVVAEKTSQAMTFHAENERLRSAVSDCRIEIQRLTAERDEANANAKLFRDERDEARRMYCGRVSRDVPLDAFDIAKNHGWDCFPQEDGK